MVLLIYNFFVLLVVIFLNILLMSIGILFFLFFLMLIFSLFCFFFIIFISCFCLVMDLGSWFCLEVVFFVLILRGSELFKFLLSVKVMLFLFKVINILYYCWCIYILKDFDLGENVVILIIIVLCD